MKLASFDIFDTTLIRKCGEPENIFYLLSKRLYPQDEARQKAFFYWRKTAEPDAMFYQENRYVTIHDIYKGLDDASFPGLKADNVIALETAIEKENLTANAEIRQLIARKRKEGYTVCFISDMYLDSRFLKETLMEQGCAAPEDKVFVSCEMRANKGEGKLYDTVRAHLGRTSRWEHYGDNLNGDYVKAVKKGIRSTLVRTGYTEPEKHFLESVKLCPFYFEASILAGYQRAARLSAEKRHTDVDNAADFVASLYIPYVRYILERATQTGLNRLYFLSRDGYIFMEIAKEFQQAYPGIELRYLFVSRYSLFLPSLYTLSKEEIYESKGGNPLYRSRIKVKEMLYLLRVSAEELGDGFKSRINFDRIRTPEQEERFFEVLHAPKVKRLVLERAAKERRILADYFRQEGLFDHDARIGSVDIGWAGSVRLMLSRILKNEGMQQHTSFYCSNLPQVLPPKYGTLYSFHNYHLCNDLPQVILMEQYYSASPYASTDSYYYGENGSVKIKFKPNKFNQNPELVETNIQTSCRVASLVRACGYIDFGEAMQVWGSIYLQQLLDISCKIDYSTLTRLGIFENMGNTDHIIRKVNLLQLLGYWYKGKIKHTVLPRQSIYYTYGIKVGDSGQCFRKRWKKFFKYTVTPFLRKLVR